MVNFDPSKRWRWVLSQAWIILVPVIAITFWIQGARAYAKDVAFINSEMVDVALWIANHTEENELIAAHDIGAIGFFANRPLLDLAGLVSPDVIPFIRNEVGLADYLDEQDPKYLVTFPGWYPELVKGVESVYETRGRFSQSPTGENMTVYIWVINY